MKKNYLISTVMLAALFFMIQPALFKVQAQQQKLNSIVEPFNNATSLNLFAQETRTGTRPVYELGISNNNLLIDVDKRAGNDETFTYANSYRFTQLFYYLTPNFADVALADLEKVADLSEYPFITVRLKASEANQVLFRLFATSGSHNANGVVFGAVKLVDVPADEWVTIDLDYTDQFAYVRNDVTHEPDSSAIYRLGMVVGNTDDYDQGQMYQGTVEIQYIKFGRTARPKNIVDRYTQNFTNFAVDPAKVWSETRVVDGVPRAPYTFSMDNGTLKVDVDKDFTPDGTSTNNFVAFKYNIAVDSLTYVDLNEYPYMSFRVKASEPISYRVQLFEPNHTVNVAGAMNRAALNTSIPTADEWTEIFVDLTDQFIHVTNSNQDTVFIQDHLVHQFIMVANFGAEGANWQGTVWLDEIKLGKAAAPKTRVESYTQDFSDFVIDPAKIWSENRLVDGIEREPYTFSLDNGTLKVDVDKNFTPDGTSTNNFVSFRYNISVDSMTVVDMNEYPYMSFKVKASEAIPYRVQVFEPNATVNAGGAMNRAALNTNITVADEWEEIFVDLTDLFIHVTNSNQDTVYIEDHLIYQFLMVPNFGGDGATWQGTVWVDDIKLGKAAAPKTLIDTYTQDFTDFVIDPAKIFSETRAFNDGQRAPYTFSLEDGALKVDVDKNFAPSSGNNNFVSFRYNISVDSMTVVDMNEFPFMSFKVKASEAIPYRVQLFEPNATVNAGGAMNRAALNTNITAADEWQEIFVDLTDQFIHVTNSNQDTVFIEDHLVYQFLMVPNFGEGGATWQGTVWVDDIKLGKAAEPVVVEPSTNNFLSEILIDGTALADFEKEMLEYDVVLPVGASDVPVVNATAEDATATVVVTAATALPGTTTILVTAEDESTREYTINFTVDDTSVNEIISRSVIYPNPTTDILRIETTMGIKSVRIFSIDGRAVHTDLFEQGYVSVQHLNKGMYLIRIEYIDGEFEHRNFIKK